MRVNPYVRELLDLTMTLVNEPAPGLGEVTRRWVAQGLPLENPAVGGDWALLGRYLDDWLALIDEGRDTERAVILNAMLERYSGPPVLTDHDGTGWHIHYRPASASLGEIIAASTTVAVAEHLAKHGMHRVDRCHVAECRRAFVDHSRPGRQRYCSQRCANRDAVRRHRAHLA